MLAEPNIHKEIAYLLCGKQIGVGQFREVYECTFDDRIVIKLENGSRSFYNIMEWQIWNAVKDTSMAKWFAPCVAISPNGSVLTMMKTRHVDKFPLRVPSFFSDIKKDNWGLYDGRVVCHDYGHNNIIEYGIETSLTKVTW